MFVSRESKNIPGRSLVLLCEVYPVAKPESKTSSEMERLFLPQLSLQTDWQPYPSLALRRNQIPSESRWSIVVLECRSCCATIVYISERKP